MTEHILKIGLDELTIVRVKCQICGVVVETSIGQLGNVMQQSQCPCCAHVFNHPSGKNVFAQLDTAIGRFKQLADQAGVEFVIPVKPSE